jgi:RNA polymerase sigma-70 factor, ECF subfamily
VDSPSDEDRHEGATLGDLLYADRSKARVPEKEWVDLVHAVAARDERALQALYQRAHPAAFTLILRITKSREVAEELLVDVFHDVWRRAAQFDATRGTVLGWIMNQARSRAIDQLRFEQRQKRVEPHPGAAHPTHVPQRSDEALELKQQERLLRGALNALSAGEREAIESAFFSDLTYTEVAVRLKQPVGTVKTRIRSGLAKLRQAFRTGEQR